jgi:raffinose/stachyose/melibiose transport system permease protein
MKNSETDLFITTIGEKIFMRVCILILAVIFLFPLYSVVVDSFKGQGFGNYLYVISHPVEDVPFFMYFKNSFIIAVGSCFLAVMISSLSGFAFSKIKFTGSKIIYCIVMMCMAISGPIIYIPFFYIMKTLHIYNTYLAVILPETVLSLPISVLMMKDYFDGLSKSLIESAYIDGASTFKAYGSIFLPLSKAAIINLGVLQLMWSFQDFWNPLMYLTDPFYYTATVAINSFKGVYSTVGLSLWRYNAALVLISLPPIIIFALAQKYIVRGVTSGAIKG